MMHRPDSVLVIAEAGVNHNGSVDLGRRLIDIAAAAGADAVKFQSFRADALVSRSASRAAYQKRNDPGDATQFEMLRRLELDEASQRALAAHAQRAGIEFMSTPFDADSLRFLIDDLDMRRVKIASGEITNGPLLLAAARTRRPLVLSTGMSTLEEVEQALGVLAFGMLSGDGPPSPKACVAAYGDARGRAALAKNVTLLHCTSDYPARMADMNLLAIDTLRDAFGIPVGLSDHSEGIAAAIAAVARGARVIEKHFTIDRSLPGPDHKASLEPGELKEMILGIRQAVEALGSPAKRPVEAELETKRVARRSLVAARDIRKGERFAAADIVAKRPGGGVSPMEFWSWIGTIAQRDYREDDPL